MGIHQELVNHLASTFFSSCFGFWRWLERQDALLALGDESLPKFQIGSDHSDNDPDPDPVPEAEPETGRADEADEPEDGLSAARD